MHRKHANNEFPLCSKSSWVGHKAALASVTRCIPEQGLKEAFTEAQRNPAFNNVHLVSVFEQLHKGADNAGWDQFKQNNRISH